MQAAANFHQAVIVGAAFGNIDLSGAKGWKARNILVPRQSESTLSICPRGRTPKVSFEEAGIPDDFIAYFAPLVRKPIEFDSCFISSSTRDQEFAHYFHSDLQNTARCWFAPHDIQGGKLPSAAASLVVTMNAPLRSRRHASQFSDAHYRGSR